MKNYESYNKKFYEDADYIVFSCDSLKGFSNYLLGYLKKNDILNTIKKFFNLKEIDKIEIDLYDDFNFIGVIYNKTAFSGFFNNLVVMQQKILYVKR